MSMKEILDLNDIVMGRVELETFKEKLDGFDLTAFEGKEVQIRGCAPVWAHLMVAGRLFGRVKSLEYLLDDGDDGIPITIFPGE
jgi:hypothetical protein